MTTDSLIEKLQKAHASLFSNSAVESAYCSGFGAALSIVRESVCSEISDVDDTKETIRHGLDCAEIFLLRHCHQSNAAAILNAVIEARAAVLSARVPVSVPLGNIINHLHKTTAHDFEDLKAVVKFAYDAAGVKYHE